MPSTVLSIAQLNTLSNKVRTILSARTGAKGNIYTPNPHYGDVSGFAPSAVLGGTNTMYDDNGGIHPGHAADYLVLAETGASLQNGLLEVKDMSDEATAMCKVNLPDGAGISDMFAPSYYSNLMNQLDALQDVTTQGLPTETSDCRSYCTGMCAASCIGFCHSCNSICTGSCNASCDNTCVTTCNNSCRTGSVNQPMGFQKSDSQGSSGTLANDS